MGDVAGSLDTGKCCCALTWSSFRVAVQRYLAEAVGTLYLVTVISLLGSSPVAKSSPLAGPLAVGSALVALIYALGHVSSAHFNPAVTFVQLLRRDITFPNAAAYLVAQLFGAFAGGLVGAAVAGADAIDYPKPADDTGAATRRAVSAEFLFTSFLVLVILHVAAAPKQAGNSFFAVAIAAVVVAGAITTGPVSGAVFNPAVSSGLVLAHCCSAAATTSSCRTATAGLWLYWVAPTAGALFGAGLFTVMVAGTEAPPQLRRRKCGNDDDNDIVDRGDANACGATRMRRRAPSSSTAAAVARGTGGEPTSSAASPDDLDDFDNMDDDDETVCLTVGAPPGREPLDPRAGQNCLRARVCQQPPR